jgi:hypothetical protein
MNIINRQDAKKQGLTRYFTGKPCIHGHVDECKVVNKTCVVCSNIAVAKSKVKKPQKYHMLRKDWRQSNPEKSAAYTRKYIAKNKGDRNLWTANYRSAKDARQPPWLNAGHLFEMESIYNYCASLRNVGLGYHVDHIVPLRGDNVSGLHVPWNLQVITGSENMSKGNRFNG